MNSEFIEKNKLQLEKEKETIETTLNDLTKEKFPDFRAQGVLDEEADEVEEYTSLVSIEETLENKLINIKKALDKISQGTYGKCEKCNKEIEESRLEVVPEADLCGNCKD